MYKNVELQQVFIKILQVNKAQTQMSVHKTEQGNKLTKGGATDKKRNENTLKQFRQKVGTL